MEEFRSPHIAGCMSSGLVILTKEVHSFKTEYVVSSTYDLFIAQVLHCLAWIIQIILFSFLSIFEFSSKRPVLLNKSYIFMNY